MNNVFILYPKRSSFGIWAFDDEYRGLINEPFVGETNTLIDSMAEESGYDIKDNPQVALLFSNEQFSKYQCALYLHETSPSGSTYIDTMRLLEPWLCPAMFKYFVEAPKWLFGAVAKKV